MHLPVATYSRFSFAAGLPVMGADEEQARLTTNRFNSVYWQCLSNEAIEVLPQICPVQTSRFTSKVDVWTKPINFE